MHSYGEIEIVERFPPASQDCIDRGNRTITIPNPNPILNSNPSLKPNPILNSNPSLKPNPNHKS